MDVIITEEMKKRFFNSFLFCGIDKISEQTEKEMLSGASVFAKGECVYKSSDFRHALGIILSGRVRVSTCDSENRMILRDMHQGETFGAAALFGACDCYVSEIRAHSECTVAFISENLLKKLFSEHPQAALNYISFLSSKIRYLNRKIAELSLRGAEARLFEYVCSNADAFGALDIPNMSALAKTLNIGRSSLYRALDSLTKNGHIIKEGNKFHIYKGENNYEA